MFTSLRLSLFFCLRTLTGFFPLYSLKGLSCFSCEATNKSLNNLAPRFRKVFCTTTTAAATFISRKSVTIQKTNPVNFSRTFKRFSFLDFSPNKSIACLIGPELQHLQTYCSCTPPGKVFHWYFVRHFGLKTPLEKVTRALRTEAKSGNLGTNYSYFHFRSNCSCSDCSQ